MAVVVFKTLLPILVAASAETLGVSVQIASDGATHTDDLEAQRKAAGLIRKATVISAGGLAEVFKRKNQADPRECNVLQCQECLHCLLGVLISPVCGCTESGCTSGIHHEGECIDPANWGEAATQCWSALSSCGDQSCIDKIKCGSRCVCTDWKRDMCERPYIRYDQEKCVMTNRSYALIARSQKGQEAASINASKDSHGELKRFQQVKRSEMDDSLQDKCTG